ncbi:hypothetical protein MKZ38_008219 [Zalerion maritima]|uniref:Uncharacterized protein n=1 Tax=Zalerion maritima TaxID=339359 RepID=A0AAD5RHA0_9PEZI|nr:hypothetical protein MKZ38_008219 [Zalerion maritima]
MTTIFIFGFFCIIVTPSYLGTPDVPMSYPLVTFLCGFVPLAFVAYSTAPIVTYMHVRLPTYARASREALEKWMRGGVSKDTELELSSMTLFARPKQTAVKVGDLVPSKTWTNMANYVLREGGESKPGPLLRKGGKWWKSTPLKKFNVQGFNRDSREGWVWEDLSRQIERRARFKGYS